MDDAGRLELAIRAAREAGSLALEHVGDPLYFTLKGHRDLLVGAAVKIQDALRESLRSGAPDAEFLGEEGPDDEELPVGADRLWVVDPIDGSINYFNGLPMYAISIAYREGGVFRVGVVYDPARDELFSATFAGGAQLNGSPIFVNRPGEGEDIYEHMVVATDLPGEPLERGGTLRGASHLASRMMTVRMLGSPALALCYIASGRLHGYFHLKLQVWDVAAAAVILRESGGTLTNLTGGSWLHSDGAYVASNAALHGEMLRLLKSIAPQEQTS
jgi:myo-inositol-1(or 4)-monophosphatase